MRSSAWTRAARATCVAGLAFGGPVTLSLAADRQETASGPATHAIMLRLDTRF